MLSELPARPHGPILSQQTARHKRLLGFSTTFLARNTVRKPGRYTLKRSIGPQIRYDTQAKRKSAYECRDIGNTVCCTNVRILVRMS